MTTKSRAGLKKTVWLGGLMIGLAAGRSAEAAQPQITSIGAEEILPGSFNGRLSSIDVDSQNQPHIAYDRDEYVGLYDKISGSWSSLVVNVAALCGSDQYYNPHLEIDRTRDLAWVSGVLYGGRLGLGFIARPDISRGGSAGYFSVRYIVPSSTWPVGNLSLDPGRPGEVIGSASAGWWERLVFDTSTTEGCRQTETGQMWTGQGGEKNSFWISKAGNVQHADGSSRAVWHGAIGGWDAWDSSYQNSVRHAQDLDPVTWAYFAQYPSMSDDTVYVGLCSDAIQPEVAYIASDFKSGVGVCANIWNGQSMIFSPASLLVIDAAGTSGLRRFAPQWAPAKSGGGFICWTRSGRIKIRHVSAAGELGAETDVTTGTMGSIATDSQGHLHLAYTTGTGQSPRYRKLLVDSPVVTGPVRGDYDGDGQADLAVYKAAAYDWLFMISGQAWTTNTETFGWLNCQPVQGDFDGDRKTDLAAYQELLGLWVTRPYGTQDDSYGYLGGSGYQPMPADYDGDGQDDLAVYSTAQGEWRFILSGAEEAEDEISFRLGGSGWQAITGDFDGDEHADLAVFSAAAGEWQFAVSSWNYAILRGVPSARVNTNDIPITGDFNGDGQSDFGVYNETDGWFVALSNPGWTTLAYVSVDFGRAGYTAAPADFDGDGKTDLAIYQASSGHWYFRLSSIGFGQIADDPIVLAPGYSPVIR